MGSFPIHPSLAAGCRACGNHTNGMLTPIRIDHDKDSPKRIFTNRDQTLFVCMGVWNRDGEGVFENGNGISKPDAMFFSIALRFFAIPLIFHSP